MSAETHTHNYSDGALDDFLRLAYSEVIPAIYWHEVDFLLIL
jgi:hypothetical protein